MADSLLLSLSEVSVPALTDILYLCADPAGTPLDKNISLQRLLGLVIGAPQSRLSTETLVPVSTADRTAQGTLYDVPCTPAGMATGGIGFMATWDGTRRRMQQAAQVSLALTLTSGKNYDVFRKNSDMSLILSNAWTNDTTRADALATAGGLIVAASDNTYVWRGTIRADGTNTMADSGGTTGTTQVGGKRFCWNAYNQLPRQMKVIDTADNWAYTSATIRQANGAAGNKVEYCVGDAATLIQADVLHGCYTINETANVTPKSGVGIDSTTTYSGLYTIGGTSGGAYSYHPLIGKYKGTPGLGYHYLAWNENGDGVSNGFYGDNGGTVQNGLTAWLMG